MKHGNHEDDFGGRMAIEGVCVLEEAENSGCAILLFEAARQRSESIIREAEI